MRVRDSGMPEAHIWERFFDPPALLESLGVSRACQDAVEFGCGYGTFTLPAARIISGTLHALDIAPEMIAATQSRLLEAGVDRVALSQRDFVREGTGLLDTSVDCALLFNILHCEDPLSLLREAYRVLRPGGLLGIIHWIPDPNTPRGPALEIRPRPEQCEKWAAEAGFLPRIPGIISLPPYHFGLSWCRSPHAVA